MRFNQARNCLKCMTQAALQALKWHSVKSNYKSVLFAFGFIFGGSASAQEVVLTSGLCGPSTEFQTAGYLFSYKGREYVLGSSEFTLNSQEASACHRIHIGGQEIPVTLRVSDWESGFSLFSLTAPIANVPELKVRSAKIAEKVMIGPHLGRILANKSERHDFVSQSRVLEVGGADIDSRQVGTPLFSGADPTLILGFVSSQYLEDAGAEGAKIRTWNDSSADVKKKVIGLTSESLLPWLESTLQGAPAFGLDALAQIEKKRVVTIGPLRFQEICEESTKDHPILDFSVGGSDGVGIGGEVQTWRLCQIDVSQAEVPNANPYGFRNEWLKKISETLKETSSSNHLRIVFKYSKKQSRVTNEGFFVSLSDFLRSFKNPEMSLAYLVAKNSSLTPEKVNPLQFLYGLPDSFQTLDPHGANSSETLNLLQKNAQTLRRAIVSFPFKNDLSFNHFGARALLVTVLMESYEWKTVSIEDLQSLLTDSPFLGFDSLLKALLEGRHELE